MIPKNTCRSPILKADDPENFQETSCCRRLSQKILRLIKKTQSCASVNSPYDPQDLNRDLNGNLNSQLYQDPTVSNLRHRRKLSDLPALAVNLNTNYDDLWQELKHSSRNEYLGMLLEDLEKALKTSDAKALFKGLYKKLQVFEIFPEAKPFFSRFCPENDLLPSPKVFEVLQETCAKVLLDKFLSFLTETYSVDLSDYPHLKTANDFYLWTQEDLSEEDLSRAPAYPLEELDLSHTNLPMIPQELIYFDVKILVIREDQVFCPNFIKLLKAQGVQVSTHNFVEVSLDTPKADYQPPN